MSDEKKNRDYAQQQMGYGAKSARGTVVPPKNFETTPTKATPTPTRVITGFRIPDIEEEVEEEEEEEDYEDMTCEVDPKGTVKLVRKETKEPPSQTMSSLMQHMFEGHQIRTVIKEDGSFMMVLKDMCDAIGVGNVTDVAARIDTSEKDYFDSIEVTSNGVSRTRKMIYISEDGLYEMLSTSKAPKSKPFRNWLFKEVLPSIPTMSKIMSNMFEGHEVRTAIRDDGSIWVALKDVCAVIEVVNSRDVAARLDDDQKADVDFTYTSSNGTIQQRKTMNTKGIVTALWLAGQKNHERHLVGLMDVLIFLEEHFVIVPDNEWDDLKVLLDRLYTKQAYLDEMLWWMPIESCSPDKSPLLGKRFRPLLGSKEARTPITRVRTNHRWGI